MATLSTWSPYDRHVQDGLADGRFLSAAFTMVAAGPPRLSSAFPDPTGAAGVGAAAAAAQALTNPTQEFALPIGVVQNLNLSQNRQFSRFWEIGSERSYFISGRTMGQVGLSKVMIHGPSLLRMMYAYYSDLFPPTLIDPVFINPAIGGVANKHDVIIPPGYHNLFLNLASDLFNQPIGLLLMLRDSNMANMGAIYLENCVIPGHNMATDVQGTVMQESLQIQYERMVPINVEAVSLIRGLAADLVPGPPVISGGLPSGGLGLP